MRIRRLSLFGFKSFYKPEDILFNDEFTCIVGSNGCGKSNLIDALRWVCGETRPSSLRVKDFDELIFAGTRTIRPLGMAQVSLVLGSDSGFVPRSTVLESDYFRNRFSNLASRSEIEITRRVYKDGEQEYLVNQIPVRLKDVRDLCRYLGLTFRSSSIIAQGEIDKLVDLKPTELRNYIEESCGLMEAVEKLNDSQEKLALAKNNIDKLRDKQSELLSRLNTLRRQLSKFERAKKAREELVKLLSIKKVLLDRELSERVLINEKELRQLNDEKTILANKLSELEQKRQDLLLRLSEFDESNDSQLDVSNIVKDMRNKQTEYQIVQAETSRKEVMRQLLLDEISVLEKELLDLRVKSELNEKKLNEIENAITEMNLQLQKAQLAVVNLERRIKQVVEEVKEVQKNLTCLREEHKALSIKCSQIETGLPNIEKLEHLRLDEYADLLGVIFSGYKDLDYVSDTYELQSNVIYLENRARDFRSAVEELAKSIMSGEGNLFYIRPSQAFKLGEFVYKPDPKLSNPLKTLSVLQGYKKNLQQLSQELSLLERREYDLNAELSSLRSSLVNNQKDIFDLKAEIRYLESVKNHILGDNSQHEIVEKERKLSKANEELMLLNQDLATLEPIRRSLELELDRLEGEFKNLKNQTKSESVSRREEVQSCIQECLTEIISIKDRLQTLELKIAEFEQNKQYFEFELKTQFHSLLEKYNIEESMVSDCKDFSNITSECQSIDEEIQRFGRESLNLLAFDESLVGEFEALEEEYNQLTTHIDDCQSSIEKLTTLREQYLREYNEAFGDYFGRVQERFNQIIGKLFPGARGQLLLVDGGLAIEVQFKNKKPSNLNQLSGGEKTLVSLSFLSALAFESGSPVLLLDEVDAPLDDFNTSRFLELVKELKKDCQVIAVTHNKMTMLAADTLLGVTLSQDGFSEALLLNLSDIPLEVAS